MTADNMASTEGGQQRHMRLVYVREYLIRALLMLCALISIVTTLAILVVLLAQSVLFFREVSIVEFLTGTKWTPLFYEKHFGILPLFAGTMLTSVIALLVSVPLGLVVAIYLSEYARASVRKVVKPFLEILAGIPTIVYGYFALITITPLLQRFIPDLSGFNALAPGLVMGFMILPLVTSLSEDALRAVPMSLREGGIALGATKLQTALTIVVPSALSGIMAAVILAFSRAIGETMIVAIAAGNLPQLTLNPLEPVSTMTAFIVQVSQGDTPYGSLAYNTIFAVAMALFVLTFVLNLISYRFRQKYQAVAQEL